LPDLGKLLQLIDNLPDYRRLLDSLQQGENETLVMLDAARPYLAATLYRNLRRPLLLITAQPEDAKKTYEQLRDWYPTGDLLLFPEPDTLPYERLAADLAGEIERTRVLAIMQGCGSAGSTKTAPFVVASAPALMGKLPDAGDFASLCHTIELGTEIDPYNLLKRWQAMGYRMEDIVEVPGAVSHRGGIVDIFPPTAPQPVRLEFFGNTIDSIRFFDPATQRSVEKVNSVSISPAAELLAPYSMNKHKLEQTLNLDLTGCTEETKQQFQRDSVLFLERQPPREAQFYASLFNKASLLDYLPSGALVVIDNMTSLEQAVDELDSEAGRMRSEKLERGELPRDFPRPYFDRADVQSMLSGRQTLDLADWGDGERLDFISAPGYAGRLPAFLHRARQLLNERRKVIIVSHQAGRLSELLSEEDVIAAPVDVVEQAPGPGSVVLVQGSLPEGWVLNDDVYLFTDSEIFGFVKQRRLTEKRPAARHKLIEEIKPDDMWYTSSTASASSPASSCWTRPAVIKSTWRCDTPPGIYCMCPPTR
jgi:transcription-repair coupling factor (superfamily II helicase)